jgi:hypothetical protein
MPKTTKKNSSPKKKSKRSFSSPSSSVSSILSTSYIFGSPKKKTKRDVKKEKSPPAKKTLPFGQGGRGLIFNKYENLGFDKTKNSPVSIKFKKELFSPLPIDKVENILFPFLKKESELSKAPKSPNYKLPDVNMAFNNKKSRKNRDFESSDFFDLSRNMIL